jgi:protocatechuate 3,4-dioxygenase beta subunit
MAKLDLAFMERRAFLSMGATLALARVLQACGDKAGVGSSSSDGGIDGAATGDGGNAGAGDSATCAETPEGEIGPYFADDSDPRFNRSNIVANLDGSNVQTGIPLTLTITVLDTMNGCAPYQNAQIDIWHCNASGVYSDQAVENTTTEQWLRGYQITDASGKVTFTTVIPGWYQGRTTHIHVRVRSSYQNASSTSDGSNTTQLFFAQTFVDRVDTSVAPYNAEGKNTTTNASDHVYSGETNGANQLTLSGDDSTGYVAQATIYIPIAAATSTGMTGGPPGGDGGGPPGDGGPPPVDGGLPDAG